MADDTFAPPMDHTLSGALEGRYTIDRELGAGGMARVFLATDLRHDRQVAIKVLKPELAAVIGAERFLREIKTIASLQHPHILGLIDSGQVNGTAFYVMPFIEGESLRDRIEREKQLPVNDAIRLATEIAGALDYAHRQGVIHRDVKPENILLHDGRALVADFGIALAVSKAGGTRMTETGMSLGTPQYMSPEQAMGEREIGPQSDVYSLGAVTYEMLVGEPPFTGPTAQAIVARIVTEEPRPLTSRRHTIPQHVESAVFTALEKLPPDRFGSTRQFADALSTPGYTRAADAVRAQPAGGVRRLRIAAIAASLLAVVATAAALAAWLRPEGPRPVLRYGIAFPDSIVPNSGMILSADGARLVYGHLNASGETQLWVKERDRYEPSPIPGAENAQAYTISPDGDWIALIQGRELRKLAISGGAHLKLADSVFFGGVAWLDDGSIVYTTTTFALRRITPEGAVTTIREPDGARAPVLMHALPGSRGILFSLCNAGCVSADLYALDLKSNRVNHLVEGAIQGWYLPGGYLAYTGHEAQLTVAAFDLDGYRIRGPPVTLLRGVSLLGGIVPFVSMSASGTLIARTVPANASRAGNATLVWVDRAGTATRVDSAWSFTLGETAGNYGVSLSPDGRRAVLNVTTSSGDDIWVKNLPNGSFSRLTFDSAAEYRPRWTPDGGAVTYVRRAGGIETGGALQQRRADGTGTVETLIPNGVLEGFRAANGWVVIRTGGEVGGPTRDIAGLPPGGGDKLRLLVANQDYHEAAPALSPDGRWIAYESEETGRAEIYVRPFPDTDAGKWQVSENGGQAPVWSRDGRELFFMNRSSMFSTSVDSRSSPGAWSRRSLFRMTPEIYFANTGFYAPFDVSPDGSRFLMIRQLRVENPGDEVFLLVDNWLEEVKARVKRTQ